MRPSKRDLFAACVGAALTVAAWVAADVWDRPRGPADEAAGAKGDRVVVIVDDATPTIEEGAVLDGPQFDGLRLADLLAVRTSTWDGIGPHNYAPLIKKAGGGPALLVLDSKTGTSAYAGKLPTDEKAAQTLLAKYVAGLPPPVPLPPPPAVVKHGLAGFVNAVGHFTDHRGSARMLASRPSFGKMAAAYPRYADSHPVYPQSAWHDIDRRNVFPWDKWGLDQGQHGSCVAQANSAMLAKGRFLMGMRAVKLSPGFLYSQINAGRDEGAVISDGFEALIKTGTCPFSVVGQEPIYAWQEPAAAHVEAKRFRIKDGYHCQTWAELGSALQTGRYLAVFGVQVGDHFEQFDRYGVAGHDPGPGNHALHADGMRKLPDGRWVLHVPNSWGVWGPFDDGRMYLDEKHLFNGSDQPDVCVFRVACDDPQDPNDPPAYKGK